MNGHTFREGSVRRCIGRVAMVSGVAMALAACGLQSNPQTFLDGLGPKADTSADLAFAEMARGDFGLVEKEVEAVLRRDPENPYALLAGGMLYQSTNRPVKARSLYEELLAQRPNKMATVGGWDLHRMAPVSEITEANMRQVDAELRRSGAWQGTSAYGMTTVTPTMSSASSGLSPVMAPSAMAPSAPPEPRFWGCR